MSGKVDFSNLSREEITKVLVERVSKWGELFAAKNYDEIRTLYCPTALILPPGQPPAHGPDGAVKSYGAAQEQGIAKVVRTFTEADVLGPDMAVTFTTWDLIAPDGTKGGTSKDITIWRHYEGEWRIYKEMFNMP